MLVDFSQLDSLDVFVLLLQKELFSLILFVFLSPSTELIIDSVELLLFNRVDLESFLLAVFDHPFEVSFAFVELKAV